MEQETPIEVNVDLEFNDFWKTLFWFNIKKSWFIYALFLGFLFPLGFIYIFILSSSNPEMKWFPALLFPFLFLIIPLIFQWSIYSSAKKSLELVKGEIRWLFYEDDFDVQTSVGKTEMSWEGIEKIEETNEHFLLFPQNEMFMVIPKRCFMDEANIKLFRELVKRKLKDRVKLK